MTMEIAVSNQTLYAIADNLSCEHETLAFLEAKLGEGPPDEEREELLRQIAEIKERIEATSKELVIKTDGLAHVLRRLGKEAEFLHEERDRLKQKEQACERAEKGLRDYTIRVMQENGWTRLKTPLNSLFLRSTEAVEILDATQVPAEFQHAEVKLSYSLWREIMAILQQTAPQSLLSEASQARIKTEPSLSLIKKAIKTGDEVPGADLQLNTHLVCR